MIMKTNYGSSFVNINASSNSKLIPPIRSPPPRLEKNIFHRVQRLKKKDNKNLRYFLTFIFSEKKKLSELINVFLFRANHLLQIMKQILRICVEKKKSSTLLARRKIVSERRDEFGRRPRSAENVADFWKKYCRRDGRGRVPCGSRPLLTAGNTFSSRFTAAQKRPWGERLFFFLRVPHKFLFACRVGAAPGPEF